MRSNVALRVLLVLVPTLFAFACAEEAPSPAPSADGEAGEEAELKGKSLATRVAACDTAFENAEDQSTAGMVEASGAWQGCLVKAVDAQKLAAKEIAQSRATVGLVCQHKSAASTEAFGTLNRVESASCPGARELDLAYLLDSYGPKQSGTIAQTTLETDACQAAFDSETNGGDAPQQTMNQAIGAQNECYVQRAVDGIVQGLLDNVAQAKADGWEDSRFTETYATDAKTVRASVEADVRAYDQSLASVCRAALAASGEDGGTLGVFLVGACQAHVFKRYLPLAAAAQSTTLTKRAPAKRSPRAVEALSLEQLRTLLAVADEGSFTAAARRLGHVQAAVSQSMQRLEGQLGLRLFDRSGRVPRLTARGEAVVGAARKVHAELAQLESFVAELAKGKEPELSIVVDSMFPPAALVAFTRELAESHPTVFLTIHTETLAGAAALVRTKGASLGIAGSDGDMSELSFRHVVDVRMVPVVAPQHPLAARAALGPIDDAELARHVQIVLGERGSSPLPATGREMAQAVLSPRTWRVVDLITKHQLLLGGVGWGHEPLHLIQEDLAAKRLVELRLVAWAGTEPRRSLALVQRRDGVLGPLGQWAAKRLAALCRDSIEGTRAG